MATEFSGFDQSESAKRICVWSAIVTLSADPEKASGDGRSFEGSSLDRTNTTDYPVFHEGRKEFKG